MFIHLYIMELKLNHKSALPLHAQAEQLLRKLIELPEYRDGKMLPKEMELASRLGISRNTLRQATSRLEYEGLIVRKKGSGTKVADKPLVTQLSSWHSFTHEMNAKGIPFKNIKIIAQWENADAKIAHFFGIEEATKVLKIARLRGDDQGPFVYFESYLHPRLGLTDGEDYSTPLYSLIEQKCHVIPSISRENLSAILPDPRLKRLLKLSAHEPVLCRERYVSDPGDRPIEYNIGYYNAQKFTYSIEITR